MLSCCLDPVGNSKPRAPSKINRGETGLGTHLHRYAHDSASPVSASPVTPYLGRYVLKRIWAEIRMCLPSNTKT